MYASPFPNFLLLLLRFPQLRVRPVYFSVLVHRSRLHLAELYIETALFPD